MFLFYFSAIFLALYAWLLFYYLYHWKSAAEYQTTANGNFIYLTVLIPARNEEKNLGNILRQLKKQTYPKDHFEIIVIDDHSNDRTYDIANSFQYVKVITSSGNVETSSKKKAIEAGIASSRGELIITTDADCIPQDTWLETINSFYQATGAYFIAAPVTYTYQNKLIQKFQAIDFMVLQGITCAGIQAGLHDMCNGANLAYSKQVFYEVGGFNDIEQIATGDDMLLMHKFRKKFPDKVFYLKSKSALVKTHALESWKDFLNQRKRWASKTFYYTDIRLTGILLFVFILNGLFVLIFIAAFFKPFYWYLVVGFSLLKTIIEWPFVHTITKFFKADRLMRYFLFFQPMHMFYTFLTGFISQSGKYSWKDRKTK